MRVGGLGSGADYTSGLLGSVPRTGLNDFCICRVMRWRVFGMGGNWVEPVQVGGIMARCTH